MVEAIRGVAGKVSRERRYYLSSLPVDVALFARAVRGHWAIENNLHRTLTMVFGEDQNRARTGKTPKICVNSWSLGESNP